MVFSEINHSNLERRGTGVKPFSIPGKALRRIFYFYSFWLIASQIHHSGEGWPYATLSWMLFGAGCLLSIAPEVNPLEDGAGGWLRFRSRLNYFLLLIVISLHVRISAIERVTVEGESMQPALREGEGLWVERISSGIPIPDLTFPFGEILPSKIVADGIVQVRRGEVILIDYPGISGERREILIKRVIALPGDRFEFANGRILVNGSAPEGDGSDMRTEPYTETYQPPVIAPPSVLERYPPEVLYSSMNGCGRAGWVPAGTLLVLGDNRPRSRDSRSIGFIPIRFVTGRMIGDK